MRERDYDVVIIGSGAAGGTVAQELGPLARDGRRIAVLEWGPKLKEEEYTGRLAAAFDAFEGSDTRVVWVGHVRTEDPAVGQTNRDVHAIAEELAAERDWVEVQDLAELTGSGDDEVSECLIADGLHLSVECYDRASAELAERLGVS